MQNKLMWTVNVILLAVVVFLVFVFLTSDEDDNEASGPTTTTTTTTEPPPVDEWVPDGPNAKEIRDLAEQADNLAHLSDLGDDWELGIVKQPMEETMSVVTATATILLNGKFGGCTMDDTEDLPPDYFRALYTPGDLVLWSHQDDDNIVCGQEIHLVHDVPGEGQMPPEPEEILNSYLSELLEEEEVDE